MRRLYPTTSADMIVVSLRSMPSRATGTSSDPNELLMAVYGSSIDESNGLAAGLAVHRAWMSPPGYEQAIGDRRREVWFPLESRHRRRGIPSGGLFCLVTARKRTSMATGFAIIKYANNKVNECNFQFGGKLPRSVTYVLRCREKTFT